MKVYIGPYRNHYSFYKLVEFLKYFKISEERRDKIADFLSNTFLQKILDFFNDKDRKVKIKIHRYDHWNANDTLALIILPVLIQLRNDLNGFAFVEDEDVPENLRSTNAPELTDKEKNCGSWNNNAEKRWHYVLDEIIWAFEQIVKDDSMEQFTKGQLKWELKEIENSDNKQIVFDETNYKFDEDGYKKHEERINNGLKLFGKYYRNLWD
jgi:hypothetical protein